MIEINLLPGARKQKSAVNQPIDFGALAAGLSGRFRDKFLVGAIAAVVVAVGATGAMYFLQSRRDTALHAHMETALRDSTHYANLLKDRYKSEAVRDTLLREVNIIRSIDADRYVWPHVLDEVSRALPQYTWLTVLGTSGPPQGSSDVVAAPKTAADTGKKAKKPKRLDTDIPVDPVQVRVAGRTVDINALTRFMRDLEASPFLGNVRLDKSELAMDQGKEVTQFQLTIDYTRPDSTQLHRVPLVLSVKQ